MLYVTSFNEKIFRLSGLRLLSTFIDYNIDAKLLICYEDTENTKYLTEIINNHNNKFYFFKLDTYDYLKSWLEENKDVIPEKYGGISKESYGEWNSKASLWFRKIASLKYTVDNYSDEDSIIWIDADCFFINHLSNNFAIDQFKNTACFYHLGRWRYEYNTKSVESGFIGFRKGDGYRLLNIIIDEYSNKQFLKYERWDDGHVIGQILTTTNIKCIDLVFHEKRTGWDVIDKGVFKDYICHNKGCHHSSRKEVKLKISNYEEMYQILLEKLKI